MGKFTTYGRAWHFFLPPEFRSVFTINFLEFCAVVIKIWLEHWEGNTSVCYLMLRDRSSAIGWLRKSSFLNADQQGYLKLARHLALLIMKYDMVLYSQHIAGVVNVVTDSLSRDFHLPVNALTYLYIT